MKKLITIAFMALILSSCSLFRPHKLAIEQGNVFTSADVAKLHTGQSEREVRNILGNPVLIQAFADNRLTYIYMYIPPYCPCGTKRLVLLFNNGRLSSIQ